MSIMNSISRDFKIDLLVADAWFGRVAHSKRVTTWYYRQDSHCSIGRWGQTENSEFNALSPLSKCYSARSNVSRCSRCLVPDLDLLKQEKDLDTFRFYERLNFNEKRTVAASYIAFASCLIGFGKERCNFVVATLIAVILA